MQNEYQYQILKIRIQNYVQLGYGKTKYSGWELNLTRLNTNTILCGLRNTQNMIKFSNIEIFFGTFESDIHKVRYIKHLIGLKKCFKCYEIFKTIFMQYFTLVLKYSEMTKPAIV